MIAGLYHHLAGGRGLGMVVLLSLTDRSGLEPWTKAEELGWDVIS